MQKYLHNHPKISTFVVKLKIKDMYKQICPTTIPMCFKVTGIYCISFREHHYIGSSKNVQKRISQHRKKLRAGKHQGLFQAYYWTFGESEMFISILEKCDVQNLKSREKYWIDTLKPDINRDGIHNTNPHKTAFNGFGSKKVYQYDMEGNYIAEFPSVMEASRYLKVDNRGIGLCADDGYKYYKSAYGYRWSYIKYEHLMPYVNNSSKAVNRPVIVFDTITGEEKKFESVAEAVRYCEPETKHFDSSCSTLCHCANKNGYYLNRYLAKNNEKDAYVLTSRCAQIFNSSNNKLYSNAKEASVDTGIPSYVIKKLCKEENNKEWLYVNQCARVKLRESGKLFV